MIKFLEEHGKEIDENMSEVFAYISCAKKTYLEEHTSKARKALLDVNHHKTQIEHYKKCLVEEKKALEEAQKAFEFHTNYVLRINEHILDL